VQLSTQSDRSENPAIGVVAAAADAGFYVGSEPLLPVRAAGSCTYGLGGRHGYSSGELLLAYLDAGQIAFFSRPQSAESYDMNPAHITRCHRHVGRLSR
jgi:hypothetical protein